MLLLIVFIITVLFSSLCFSRVVILDQKVVNRASSIDGLRGILALCVFTHHYYITYFWKTTGEWRSPNILVFENLGSIGVSMFFMITGYLFLDRINRKNINWKQLYWSRIKRIYPLYVFVCTIAITLVYYNYHTQKHSLWFHLKFILNWLQFHPKTFEGFYSSLVIAGVQWTLIYEWKFYLLLPIIYFTLKKIKLELFFLLTVFVLTLCLFLQNIPSYFLLFFLAIPAILYKEKIFEITQKHTKKLNTLAYLTTFYLFFYTKPYSAIQMTLVCIIFTLIAVNFSYKSILNNKFVLFLGEISYSIYLLHGIILYIAFTQLKILNYLNFNFYYYCLFYTIIFGLVICCASLSHHFIEKRFI